MARHHYETLQQVFDDAYRGLAAQGFVQSRNQGVCAYRGLHGRKCAVGHCIPDDLYTSALEGLSPLADRATFQHLFGDYDSELRLGLARLQVCHDSCSEPDAMRARLSRFADSWDLTIPSVEEAA